MSEAGMETRICYKCGLEKPISSFVSYYNQYLGRTLFRRSCRECPCYVRGLDISTKLKNRSLAQHINGPRYKLARGRGLRTRNNGRNLINVPASFDDACAGDTRHCSVCKVVKPCSAFTTYKTKRKGEIRQYYHSFCHPCLLRYSSEYNKKVHNTLRDMIYAHYGNKCACCGETQREFLSIDHVGGWGKNHRSAKTGKRVIGVALYTWIVKNMFPASIQILCYNCNCALGVKGYCPHQQYPNFVGDWEMATQQLAN